MLDGGNLKDFVFRFAINEMQTTVVATMHIIANNTAAEDAVAMRRSILFTLRPISFPCIGEEVIGDVDVSAVAVELIIPTGVG